MAQPDFRGYAADDGELVLGVADALLELPAVGVGLAALDPLELGLRLLELRARPLLVDLRRVDGVVDERERAVLLDLEEARARSRTRAPRSPRRTWTRVEPALSIATSGACRASTPISPAAPGTISISASPSNAAPSGVTSETSKLPPLVGHYADRLGLRLGSPAARSAASPPSRGPSRRPPRSCRPCRRPARAGRRACPRGSPGSP